MEQLTTDVLVVGGSTGGTAAAIQAARCGVNVTLVTEFAWLGGMLTSAGVSAPDGNELRSLQSGLWGCFLRELQKRQPGGLDNGWVSFFTYHPAIGAAIFADWVKALPNLTWIVGQTPLEVSRMGDRLTGVRFQDYAIAATMILDGTELGDVLDLGQVPHRWGWEFQDEWGEPSAPTHPNPLTETYPVQTPTWVVMMRDWGEGAIAPKIPLPKVTEDGSEEWLKDWPQNWLQAFEGAWAGYGTEEFLNYGRLPGDRFMINWPQHGNDYSHKLQRLVTSAAAQRQVLQEAHWFSQCFAHYIQTHLGRRYGLADDMFPTVAYQPNSSPSLPHAGIGGGAFALQPYYRESRRLIGLTTIREQDILPLSPKHPETSPTQAAPLPLIETAPQTGQSDAIAIGNYPNDHHYPAPASQHLTLTPKSLRWGGRWTGTLFALPYRCLVPAQVDGLLVCEKNMSVSHIANGATRLQPVVMGVGQAAGLAAALCVKQRCQPRQLSVLALQDALLTDAIAPAAVVPLFNLPPYHPDWLYWQRYYLHHPDAYPAHGYAPLKAEILSPDSPSSSALPQTASYLTTFSGLFRRLNPQQYELAIATPTPFRGNTVSLVALDSVWDAALQSLSSPSQLQVRGRFNAAGRWIVIEDIVQI